MKRNEKWEVEYKAVLIGVNKNIFLAKIRYLDGVPIGFRFDFVNERNERNKIDFIPLDMLGKIIPSDGETITLIHKYQHLGNSEEVSKEDYIKQIEKKEKDGRELFEKLNKDFNERRF